MFFVLECAAWLGATTLPLLLASLFWNAANRSRFSWLIHLGFGPCIVMVEWATILLLGYAAHDDGTGGPGLGFILIPAGFTFLLALGGYYICFSFSALRAFFQRP